MKFISLVKKIWPQLFLFFLVTVLCYQNFTPDTYLIGWDNLPVELDLGINLERTFNAVWQEYQGLGLLGGMAHGADLIRQLLLWPLSLILKQEWLRYFWNYLTLLFGVLGAFRLFAYLLRNNKQRRLLAVLGASFYLLNLGTVQNFYVTFEPFAAFFAFFPWLIYYFLSYLEQSTKKNLSLFILFSLLGTIFAYVQTVFIVYLLILLLILAFFLIKKKITWKKFALVLLIVFLSNAFWLLPVIYFTIFASSTTIDAKINLMSTEVTFLKNNQFGSFANLATLKGFWLDYTDFNQWGNSVYLMDVWKTHFHQPGVIILSWLYFLLLLFGLGLLIFSKKNKSFLAHSHLAILLVFLFTVFILAGSNPPLAFLYDFLRQHLPLFGQIFRSAFSKWIVPYSLFYSFLVTFGLAWLFSLLKKKLWQFILSGLFFLSLLYYSLPSFTGNFFYSRLRVNIPDAYFQLFDYFKDQAPASGRIANLPQHTFYGWQWNDWGYRGSGFIWYGIKQPILDRAFDVWSEASERYYWQLQSALDRQDIVALENVLDQYEVDYLILDESIINRNTKKPFNYQVISDFLESSANIHLVEQYDFLSIYQVKKQPHRARQEFIGLYDDLPRVINNYRFSWLDQAFADLSHYLSLDDQLLTEQRANSIKPDFIYPFPALFSNHLQKDLEFSLSEDEHYFYLTSLKTSPNTDFQLYFPDLLKSEQDLPFRLTWLVEDGVARLNFSLLAPEIIEQEQITSFTLEKDFVFDARLCLAGEACYLNVNNHLISQLENSGQIDLLLNTKVSNTIALSSEQSTAYFDYAFFDLNLFNVQVERVEWGGQTVQVEQEPRQGVEQLLVKIPRVILQSNVMTSEQNLFEPVDCRPLQEGSVAKEQWAEGTFYQVVGTSVCDHFPLANLKHDLGYLIRLKANNLASLPAVFAVQSDSSGRSPIETYLSEGVNYQVLPPTEDFNQAYTLYLSIDSYGRELNEDLIESAEVFFWPYNFLKNLSWRNSTAQVFQQQSSACDFTVYKRALWLYQVNLSSDCQTKYLTLAQAFDPAWVAYQAGQKLEQHQLSNWANAWLINKPAADNHIYIVYWPQLLELGGFMLLLPFLIIFLAKWQKNRALRLEKKSSL